ncbi:hypothetical protein QE152_g21837 [Popillia japonica]|uniref:Uncharacterized protein n=1 Tax=Popillia japonica TaxID=7064 RepID=A0AAW1KNQ2_POPJA
MAKLTEEQLPPVGLRQQLLERKISCPADDNKDGSHRYSGSGRCTYVHEREDRWETQKDKTHLIKALIEYRVVVSWIFTRWETQKDKTHLIKALIEYRVVVSWIFTGSSIVFQKLKINSAQALYRVFRFLVLCSRNSRLIQPKLYIGYSGRIKRLLNCLTKRQVRNM